MSSVATDEHVRRGLRTAVTLSMRLLGSVDDTAGRVAGARSAFAGRLPRPRRAVDEL